MKEIVKYAIYPPIGIARVGNSPDEWFVGPEVPGHFTNPPGGYKDSQGRIKRQAAKFRVYGVDRDGNGVAELPADNTEIQWTVHLANKKADWYHIEFAMDIPEAKSVERRNPLFKRDRKDLIIDPGPRSVSVKNLTAAFNTGKFLDKDVPLGEILIDSNGHLLVLGGSGSSAGVTNKQITGFDNEEWYDDNADGPVTAQVKINGKEVEVDPAWVIVAPPDFAPGIRSVVTLYDLAYQVAVNHFKSPEPKKISFAEHVYPIFETLANLQWVNAGLFLDLGWGTTEHFLDPHVVDKLADNSEQNESFRVGIFKKFRKPDELPVRPDALPPIYGDARGSRAPQDSPRKFLSLTSLQYRWLKKWALGDFQSDYDKKALMPRRFEDVKLEDRPKALTRAALENCQGGPFHPGCEAPWIMRQPLVYASEFRIKHKPANSPEVDYGEVLSPQTALSSDGPLNGSSAGDITRWMAIPWQIDAFRCGAAFDPQINPHLPTFWPARVPNHVLADTSYNKMLDPRMSNTQRFKHFSHRQEWLRHYTPIETTIEKAKKFIEDWAKLGIITRMSAPGGTGDLPAEVFVEMKNLP